MTRLILTLFLVLSLGACADNPYFSDDEGAPRGGGSQVGEHPDELSQPYALGTQVIIRALDVGGAGWRIESDDPAVLAVEALRHDDDGKPVATCRALAEGEARLRLVDEQGAERRAAQVRVRAPDRARLFSHGELRILGRDADSFDAAEVSAVQVLAGGKAVFAVAYYRGEERVYGRGIAELDAPAGLAVENETTSGFATNEFLFVTPGAAGASELVVGHRGVTLARLGVTAVDESALAGLSLAEEQGGGRNDGDQVWILARARDGAGREVLGVYADWTLGGEPQKRADEKNPQQRGDLYRYEVKRDAAPRPLTARRGALESTLDVRAKQGHVEDTTYLGCSAAPGAPGAPGTGALALLALVLLLRRLRRGSAPA